MNRLFLFVMIAIAISFALLLFNHDRGMTFGLSNDKFAGLVALSLIALSFGFRALQSGAINSVTLRNLAIWLAIFAGLIAIYPNRFNLQNLASSATLGLVPASPQSSLGNDGSNVVNIGRSNSGQFEVESSVNNSQVRFLVDTGASGIVLSWQDAQAAGIDVEALSFDVGTSTANGDALAARARIDEMMVGTIIRRNMRAFVSQEGKLDQSLLGMEFLNSLSSYKVKQDEMTLFD